MRLKRRNVEIVEHDKDKIRALKAEGFKVIDGEPTEENPAEKVELKEMTVKELKALAKDKGITLSNALKKNEIIEFLEATNDGNSETETA